MDAPALPIIVIKVNIGCCEACPQKLGKLLSKTEGVESFDMAKDSVTIKGLADPHKLVKSIAKALNKKKTHLLRYEVPKQKEKDAAKDKGKEKEHSGPMKETKRSSRHGHDNKETHPIHGDHHNPNYNHHFHPPPPPNPHYPPPRGPPNPHFQPPRGPPNPHYPPPRGPPHHHNYEDNHHGQYYGGAPHQRHYEGYNQDMHCPLMQDHDMAPRHRYNNSYTEARHVPATNNVLDYFSNDNASGCVIM